MTVIQLMEAGHQAEHMSRGAMYLIGARNYQNVTLDVLLCMQKTAYATSIQTVFYTNQVKPFQLVSEDTAHLDGNMG